MAKALFVRHAPTQISPSLVPARWPLTEAGRRDARVLAARLRPYHPTTIFTSEEPKAAETGAILAAVLELPCTARPGLQEHERPAFDRLSSREAFTAQIADFFANPEALVFGLETAAEALARFEAAAREILAETAAGSPVIVTHGTVLTLLVAAHNPIEPLAFWKSLAMPDLVALDSRDFSL